MKIVEVGDYSVLAMKDSEDSLWFSPSSFCKRCKEYHRNIIITKTEDYPDKAKALAAKEFESVCRGVLLYFNEKVSDFFKVGDDVMLL